PPARLPSNGANAGATHGVFGLSNRLIQSGIVSRSASILLSSVISLGSCGMSFDPPVFVGKQWTPEASLIADVACVLIDHLPRVRRLRSIYHVSMLAVFNGETNGAALTIPLTWHPLPIAPLFPLTSRASATWIAASASASSISSTERS